MLSSAAVHKLYWWPKNKLTVTPQFLRLVHVVHCDEPKVMAL